MSANGSPGNARAALRRWIGEFQCPRRTVLLHDLEELDHDLRHRADEDLALATLLRVVHRLRFGRRRDGGRSACYSQTLENINSARRWRSDTAGSRRPRVHTRLRNAATRTLRVSLRTLMRTMVGYLSTCVFCASERGRTNARDPKLLAEKNPALARKPKKKKSSTVKTRVAHEDAAVITLRKNRDENEPPFRETSDRNYLRTFNKTPRRA